MARRVFAVATRRAHGIITSISLSESGNSAADRPFCAGTAGAARHLQRLDKVSRRVDERRARLRFRVRFFTTVRVATETQPCTAEFAVT